MATLHRRRRTLEKQIARLGFESQTVLLLELEHITTKIRKYDAEAQRLKTEAAVADVG